MVTKKTTSLAITKSKLSPAQLATIQKLGGQDLKSNITIKKIAVDYRSDKENYGGFSFVSSEKNENDKYEKKYEVIGKYFECVILKKRYIAKRFDPDSDKVTYYTREFDDFRDPINIYSVDNKKEPVNKGIYKDMKLKYLIKPKMILYVYFLNTEEVCRLEFSSSTMIPFGDYEKNFYDTFFGFYITKISTKSNRKGETSPIYFTGEFKAVGEFDEQKTMELVKDLSHALNIYAENTAQEEEEVVQQVSIAPSYSDTPPPPETQYS